MEKVVRTRIAPSPTGFPHIGTIFQALFNYAYAKHRTGQFIVRIEDTDQARKVEGAEKAIFEALDWFGLTPDESSRHGGPYPPYRQSEKLDRYKERAQWLVDQNKAYYCFCTSEELDVMRKKQQQEGKPSMYDGKCKKLDPDEAKERAKNESHVIRMKILYKDPIVKIHDDIRGDIKFETKLIDDQIILKSDNFPTYHLAVVVDDYDMKITQVIRGEEWISSTPKHVLLRQYFGWDDKPLPYLHTPLLRNPDGSKLSKRHGHAEVSWYQEQGFLPEAILNYLANLVYSHPKGEIFSLEEFVSSFDDRTKIHSVGAKFDLTKLEWINGEYIRKTENSKLKALVYEYLEKKIPEDLLEKLTPLAKERMKKLADMVHYLKPFSHYVKVDLEQKYQDLLANFVPVFETTENWNTRALETKAKEIVTQKQLQLRDAFMALRLATTGEKIGLPLFETWEILGKPEVIKRLKSH